MKTLLEMVQDILYTIDSDTVNSISDTYESVQIVNIVRNVYKDIVTEYNLPTTKKLSYLQSVSNTSLPTHLRIPTNVKAVLWWKYDKRAETADPVDYKDVTYLSPQDFVEHCNRRDSTDTTNNLVIELDGEVTLVLDKLTAPTYWTSFDNDYIVCDSYDSTVDTTMQQSKTQAYVDYGPVFTVSDSFTPSLPENLEQLFYRTAESTAYALFKQQLNPKLEQKEHILRTRAQRNKEKLDAKQNNRHGSPNYGRHG